MTNLTNQERIETYLLLMGEGIRVTKRLGFGQDGEVWATSIETAIKVFERSENYKREVGCYDRLAERGVKQIGGFHVPELIDCHDELHLLEMSIVTPPYLLDFGKAYLDAAPDFSAEVLADWERERSGWFESGQWPIVKGVLAELALHGVYYYDAKPANIFFG